MYNENKSNNLIIKKEIRLIQIIDEILSIFLSYHV